LYGQVANVGADNAWPQYRRVVLLTMKITALIASLAWLLAPWIVKTVAGESFGPTVDYFRMLLLALISMSFSTMMAPQWIGRGFFAQVAAITIFIGGISLILCLILIPIYGAKGAIWASLVTYSLGLAFNVAMMVRCEKIAKLAN
jgi:O-antigen/teichoic acid export membrane protein